LEIESGKPPNGGRDIRPRREPGHDLLDLPLLLSAGRVEHLAVIGGSQVRCEEPRRGQGDRSRREHLEDDGKPPGRAGHLNAVVALAFREPESIPAVDVEGLIALAEVHVPRVHLGKVSDEVGRRITLARDQALHSRDELGVGEASERSEDVVLHVRVVARSSDTLRRTT
jgi:hypothetical protein